MRISTASAIFFQALFAGLVFFQGILKAHPTASDDEERLLIDIFRDYNNLIRPSINDTPIVVEFGMAMILLINVDEKNQIMQTNVWLTLKWYDYQIKWKPSEYGHITTIRVPPDKVWLPDIVLFNNADGNYEVSFHSNVVVESKGSMLWVPPAIYKSSCTINVEYFPFDEQTCHLVFGSWTYNSVEVQLAWYNGKDQVELNDYSFSGIWDIMEVPGRLDYDKSRIIFSITIRRKTLFYTVILIIPTILMAFLSMMVFYLPADASEKITLAISILLALVVFLLLVSKILPPTSTTIPLMAKYLLLTFVMNIVTILVTVVVINIYFRGPTTHRMPFWARILFLDILPQFLLMKRPRRSLQAGKDERSRLRSAGSRRPLRTMGNQNSLWPTDQICDEIPSQNQAFACSSPCLQHHPNCKLNFSTCRATSFIHFDINRDVSEVDSPRFTTENGNRRRRVNDIDPSYVIASEAPNSEERKTLEERFGKDGARAIGALEYITDHLKHLDNCKKVCDDWKYMAMVIDRLLLYLFFGVTAGGTLGILMSAPNVFQYIDQASVIERIRAKYPNF